MMTAPDPHTRRFLARWLFVCAFLVWGMVVVGGLTRLTESGLSIVDWRPVTGAIPPLNSESWAREFAKYQASPQYKLVNRDMTVETFKSIFWLEYLHRLLGRLIGFVFFLPFAALVATKRVRGALAWKLAGILALGGVQGLIGWLMVRSGLQDIPAVSHLRLTLHLGTAVLLFGLLLWEAMRFASPPPRPVLLSAAKDLQQRHGILRCAQEDARMWIGAATAATLVFCQILLGGMVAGLDAGLAYNTFPLMNGDIVPPEAFVAPWIANHALIQFLHRCGAYLVAGSVLWLCVRCLSAPLDPATRRTAQLVGLLVLVQFTLGVLTLLNGVPVALASLHQAVAVLLFAAVLRLAFQLKHAPLRDVRTLRSTEIV